MSDDEKWRRALRDVRVELDSARSRFHLTVRALERHNSDLLDRLEKLEAVREAAVIVNDRYGRQFRKDEAYYNLDEALARAEEK